MTEKTVTKAVRLDRDIADFYGDKPLRGILESLYDLSLSGKVDLSGGEVKIHCNCEKSSSESEKRPKKEKNSAFSSYDAEIMGELESMATCWEVEVSDLLADFVILLREGAIERRDGMLWAERMPDNWEDFKDECEKHKATPEQALKKFMRLMG